MNSENYFDVIIIGSGPAGASSAYLLAKNNLKVLVIEKEKLPRYKTCGGGLTYRALSVIPFNIDDVCEIKCYTTQIYDGAELNFETNRSKPMVSMVMRKNFDYELIKQSEKLGVKIKENCCLQKIIFKENIIEVFAGGRKFYSKFIIAADGAHSKTAKLCGFQNPKYFAPALEYEVFVDDKTLNKFNDTARFDFGIVQSGYGWVFPKDDHLSIGVLNMRNKKINLNNSFKEYLKILQIKNITKLERHGYAIPLNPAGKKFAKDRVFLTGDAAGLADPITGEGINNAIFTGKLAAESLIKNSMQKNISEDCYNSQISKQILPELNTAKKLSYLIYNSSLLRKIIFNLYGHKLSELITDIIMGEKNYTQVLKDPLNYLKLFKISFQNKTQILSKFTT